jgi:hypothetical protein
MGQSPRTELFLAFVGNGIIFEAANIYLQGSGGLGELW